MNLQEVVFMNVRSKVHFGDRSFILHKIAWSQLGLLSYMSVT